MKKLIGLMLILGIVFSIASASSAYIYVTKRPVHIDDNGGITCGDNGGAFDMSGVSGSSNIGLAQKDTDELAQKITKEQSDIHKKMIKKIRLFKKK